MDLKTLLLLLVGFVSLCRSSEKASSKSSNDQKVASSNYKTVEGPDDKGNNYIPFQWQVEIIKREYDDYVLPDGTVYRVPHGAVPPHRYKGSGPYDVPYYVFKEDKGHSGQGYGNKPKLVETYDTQTLELMLQDWYQEELWSRGYGDKRYPVSQEYYGDYDNGGSYAPSDKHEKTYGHSTQPRHKYKSNSPVPNYFMRSFNGTQRWSDRDYSPASSKTSSSISADNYGSNPQIGQVNRRRMAEALRGRPRNINENFESGPSDSENVNKTPDSNSRDVHPFISRFRGGLSNNDGHESYS